MFTLSSMLVLAFAPAPTQPATPTGAAPRVEFVIVRENVLVSTKEVIQEVGIPTVRPVNVNGQIVNVMVLVPQKVTKQVEEVIEPRASEIYDATGKAVNLTDALKRLKNGGVIILSMDGKMVDPLFLKAFKDDTLVLVFKNRGTEPPKQDPSLPK